MTGASAAEEERFSLVAGGRFDALLDRFGLMGNDQLPTPLAAVVLALVAWMPPALLAVGQSLLDSGYSGWGFFADGTVYARYLVAIVFMIGTERYADWRLTRLAGHFRESNLLPGESLQAFSAALRAADRRSSSATAELVMLGVAIVWSGLTTSLVLELTGSGWEGKVVDGTGVMSWAGEAARFVSNPLFLFLTFRWIWRFMVWTLLLFRISRLPLQLAPLNPDRAAGLGFLAIYPGIFNGFVFALSCVVASSMLKDLALEQHGPDTVWLALAVWLGICLVLVLGPLVVFAWPLYLARERALLEYGRLANQHNVAFHRKWIEGGRSGEDLIGSPDLSSVSSLNATLSTVRDQRFFPVDGVAVFQLVLAAALPLVIVVATQVPVGDMLQWILGKIL